MRLFTALPIKKALYFPSSGLTGARWIDPCDYHITLRFIGDVPRNIAFEIADELARVDFIPFEVSLTNYEYFGGNKPHSFHIAVEKSDALIDFQKSLESLMRRMGLPPETRKFTPHITLANLSRACSEADILNYISTLPPFIKQSIIATHFNLYASKDLHGGGPYAIVQSYDNS